MFDDWDWRARKRFFFAAKLAAWALSVPVILVLVNLMLPGIFAVPWLALMVCAGFLAVPAWLQMMWTNEPGYFMISRLSYEDAVARQVSLAERRRSLGAGSAPESDWKNLVTSPRDTRTPHSRVSLRTDWDQWLFVSAMLLGVQDPDPRTSSTARVDVSPEGIRILPGYLWPGVILDLAASQIVGIWMGSELTTIGGRQVLVLTVRSGQDQILLPFQVHSWRTEEGRSKNVGDLVAALERVWGVSRDVPPPAPPIRPRRIRS